MDLIYADTSNVEVGFLPQSVDADFDIGDTNDFELTTTTDSHILDYGYRVFDNGSEIGGIVSKITVNTADKSIKYGGKTWRGLLADKIICPASSADYRTISGTVSSIISALITEFGIGELFVADSDDTTISGYQFDRYCTFLAGVEKMLSAVNRKIRITYGTDGKVHLSSVAINDYSELVELSQDGNINMTIEQDKHVVNHLICLGKGELKDRIVAHLYLDKQNGIGTTQYYFGADEIVQTYDYSSAEFTDDLISKGTDKFKELLTSNKIETSLSDDIDIDLHDIIGGRERITGISVKVSVTNKIIKLAKGRLTTSYKVG